MKTLILCLAIVTLNLTSINAQIAKAGSVGVGLGVPYGAFGLNGEVAVHNNFSLSAGIGSTIFAGLGYAVGARAYFKPVGTAWRPRISIHYGVNGLTARQESNSSSNSLPYDGKTFNGITIGIGYAAMFGQRRNSGFDFDVVYLATTGGLQDEIDKMNASNKYTQISNPGKIKIVIGYRFAF